MSPSILDEAVVWAVLIRLHPKFTVSPASGYRLLEHVYAEPDIFHCVVCLVSDCEVPVKRRGCPSHWLLLIFLMGASSLYPQKVRSALWTDGPFRTLPVEGSLFALSHNGKRFARISKRDDVEHLDVYDTATGQRIRRVALPHNHVVDFTFSPDGKRVGMAMARHVIVLYDIEQDESVYMAPIDYDQIGVRSLSFSPTGPQIAATYSYDLVLLWGADPGDYLCTLYPKRSSLSDPRRVTKLLYSPYGERLAVAENLGAVRLYETEKNRLIGVFGGQGSNILSIAFSNDGSLLACGDLEGMIRIWDVRSQTLRRVIEGHEGAVTSVAFLQRSDILLSGSLDGTARLWDVETGQNIKVIPAAKEIHTVAAMLDGKTFVIASTDTLDFWRYQP